MLPWGASRARQRARGLSLRLSSRLDRRNQGEANMALIQWREAFDPFRDLRELQDRVNRLFDDRGGFFGVERGTSTFPPLDIREDAENVYVVAELPGIPLEALEVSITGDT